MKIKKLAIFALTLSSLILFLLAYYFFWSYPETRTVKHFLSIHHYIHIYDELDDINEAMNKSKCMNSYFSKSLHNPFIQLCSEDIMRTTGLSALYIAVVFLLGFLNLKKIKRSYVPIFLICFGFFCLVVSIISFDFFEYHPNTLNLFYRKYMSEDMLAVAHFSQLISGFLIFLGLLKMLFPALGRSGFIFSFLLTLIISSFLGYSVDYNLQRSAQKEWNLIKDNYTTSLSPQNKFLTPQNWPTKPTTYYNYILDQTYHSHYFFGFNRCDFSVQPYTPFSLERYEHYEDDKDYENYIADVANKSIHEIIVGKTLVKIRNSASSSSENKTHMAIFFHNNLYYQLSCPGYPYPVNFEDNLKVLFPEL